MAYEPKAMGPKTPEKYPVAPGRNYDKYGEQPGWIYDPYKDHYYPDPNEQKKLQEAQGILPKTPKPKGLLSTLAPVAGAVTIYKAADIGGNMIADKYKLGAASEPLSNSGDAAAAITNNAPSANAAQAVSGGTPAPTQGAGLLSSPSQPMASGGQTLATGPQSGTTAGMMENGQSAVPGGEIPGTTQSTVPDTGVLGTGYSGAQLAQGGLGLLQGYQGLKQLQQGNYLGGGLNLAGGVGNVAQAANYAGAGSQTLGSAMPFLNGALGVYNGIQTANMIGSAPSGGKRNAQGVIGGATSGAAIGSVIPIPGATIAGAIIGGLTGLAGSVFGSSKGERQQYRDQVRGFLQKNNILDKDYNGTLADGSKYNFGGDGSKIKVDYKNPIDQKVIGLSNVISAVEGNYGKGGEATSELYASGALSNAGGDYNKAKQNILHFANQRGFTKDAALAQLQKMKEQKQISESQHAAFVGGVNELYGNQTRTPAQGTVQTGRGLLRR